MILALAIYGGLWLVAEAVAGRSGRSVAHWVCLQAVLFATLINLRFGLACAAGLLSIVILARLGGWLGKRHAEMWIKRRDVRAKAGE